MCMCCACVCACALAFVRGQTNTTVIFTRFFICKVPANPTTVNLHLPMEWRVVKRPSGGISIYRYQIIWTKYLIGVQWNNSLMRKFLLPFPLLSDGLFMFAHRFFDKQSSYVSVLMRPPLPTYLSYLHPHSQNREQEAFRQICTTQARVHASSHVDSLWYFFYTLLYFITNQFVSSL